MNQWRKSLDITEAKIQASILLKSYRLSEKQIANRAAQRFQRLAEFADYTIADILEKTIKHKHALAVIALENGFKSWFDFKAQTAFIVGGFLNKWFTSYEEAKLQQQLSGGFLFPYKHQFFICEEGYIKYLGLDPRDVDWKLIDYDYVYPLNKAAWLRLYKKRRKVQERQT